ncbi:hypothetical protein TKK_0000434 [Trichogramma kaykai]
MPSSVLQTEHMKAVFKLQKKRDNWLLTMLRRFVNTCLKRLPLMFMATFECFVLPQKIRLHQQIATITPMLLMKLLEIL